MRYVMVTDWDGHWDGLINNSTYYTTNMFGRRMNGTKIKENIRTIFVKKKRETGELEKTWVGKVYNCRKSRFRNKLRIHFNVEIDHEIICPSKYVNYPTGWYVDEDARDESWSDTN